MPLGMEVGLGPGDFALDGDQPPEKRGHSPQFSAHVCIRIALGTEVGLRLGDIVLDGDPSAP